MDRLLKKLAAKLQSEAIEGVEVKFTEIRKDQDKVVNVAELKAGPLYARIVPVTDDYGLLNAEVYTHKMRRAKITHASPEMLTDNLVAYAREAARPSPTQQLKSKGIEPEIDRVVADVEKLSDEELDELIEKLEEEWEEERREAGVEVDGDEQKEAEAARKNVVSTFPKDRERVEGDKLPHKAYNRDMGQMELQTPREGLVNWAGTSRLPAQTMDGNGLPTRMDESFKNKVMVYHKTKGVIFVDKNEYQNYLNQTQTKLIVNEKGEATFGQLNESNKANFMPTILRGKR